MGIFSMVLSLLSGVALFLFGMSLMGDGLKLVAGNKLEAFLYKMTNTPLKGVALGTGVTSVIQSSSATTVMVVSFVNAGLLTLSQSIGVIMGANIGTTVTAWIISALGFKVDIAAFALPLLAFGIPVVVTQMSNRKSVVDIILGVSFLVIRNSYEKTNGPD